MLRALKWTDRILKEYRSMRDVECIDDFLSNPSAAVVTKWRRWLQNGWHLTSETSWQNAN